MSHLNEQPGKPEEIEIRKLQDRGQIQIPSNVRKKMGIEPKDQIAFIELSGGEFLIRKVDTNKLRQIVMIDPKTSYETLRDGVLEERPTLRRETD